jgi:hypothetical protein
MRRFSLIMILFALAACGGCKLMSQAGDSMKTSLGNAANSYHRVTTGGKSDYIKSQRAH